MHIDVIAIQQRYALSPQSGDYENSAVSSVLVFKLPSGREVSVPITEEEAASVIEASVVHTSGYAQANGITEDNGYTPSEITAADSKGDPTLPALTDDTIEWLKVPDDVLPVQVKAEFLRQQLPARLPIREIGQRARDIMAPPPDRPNQAGVGEVERGVQLPGRGRFIAPRIETDEAGNPLVAQVADDPGEIMDDETGARSI